jgi:hypothetical protein
MSGFFNISNVMRLDMYAYRCYYYANYEIILRGVFLMQKLRKLQVKGFVVGMLVMFMLSGGAVYATSRTQNISISFNGIRLVVNGELVTPRDGAGNVVEPFIWNGTTYLPVRAIANALGLEVDWDSNTQTVSIGGQGATVSTPVTSTVPAPSSQARPLREAAPFYDRRPTDSVVFLDIGNMGGNEYRDLLQLSHHGTAFSLHNLNGQFTTLSGSIGRIDGSPMRDAIFNIYGDGTLLQRFELSASAMPISINIPVRGVTQLRIEMIALNSGLTSYSRYGFNGFLE